MSAVPPAAKPSTKRTGFVRDTRCGRERGSARRQMEKLSAWEFHDMPSINYGVAGFAEAFAERGH